MSVTCPNCSTAVGQRETSGAQGADLTRRGSMSRGYNLSIMAMLLITASLGFVLVRALLKVVQQVDAAHERNSAAAAPAERLTRH